MSRKWKEMKPRAAEAEDEEDLVGEEEEEEVVVELEWFWKGRREGTKWVMLVSSQGSFSIRIGHGVDEGVLVLVRLSVEAWAMVVVVVGSVPTTVDVDVALVF